MLAIAINAETIALSGTYTSDGISLGGWCSGFSLYYEITGDGTVDFFHYVSLDGENFVREDRAINRGLTKTSGPGGDGKGVLHIPVMPCDAFKIEAVETGGANSVVVTAKALCREGRFGDFPTYDGPTNWTKVISGPHHEGHEAKRFHLTYSVASLGAMTTPDDMITLTWTTPDTTAWEHFTFWGEGISGARVRLIEAPSGGAESQTEQFPVLNHNRNSDRIASCIALDSTVGEVSYDATLATGGTSLWDQYVAGGRLVGGQSGSDRDEIILKQNTKYQLSIFDAGNNPATLHIDWYELTNR